MQSFKFEVSIFANFEIELIYLSDDDDTMIFDKGHTISVESVSNDNQL